MPDPKQVLEQARKYLASKRYAAALEILAGELELKAPSSEALQIAGRAEQALEHHAQAAKLLARAVHADPDSAGAHHALGNVQQDLGRIDLAIASYRNALRLDPQLSAAENDLGTAYFAKGLHKRAAEAFERCIALDPESFRAYENLGSVLRNLDQFASARRAFKRAFWIKLWSATRRLLGLPAVPRPGPETAGPDQGNKLAMDAYDAYRAGQYDEAERLCARCLERNPNDFAALHVRALTLNQCEQYPVALAILEMLVRKAPDSAETHDALGTSLRGMRRYDAALESFNRALALNPKSPVIHSNVSALMIDRADYASAETAARAALLIDPDFGAAIGNLGVALIALGRPAEAEMELRRAVTLNPRSPKPRLRLCEALRDQDKLDEMKLELERVRAIDADNPDLYLHMGLLAQDIDRDVPAALAHFRTAQQLAPKHPGPYLDEALLRLMNRDFSRQTWDLYEWRKRMPDRIEGYLKVALPDWDGSKVGPGELLVYGEQGLGDELMFASMLPQALALAPRLRLAAQPRLASLLARSYPGLDVVAWDRTLGPPDSGSAKCAVAMGSLGRYFRCALQDFPPHKGYLAPDPQQLLEMRARLQALGPGRTIGLSWRGGVPLTWHSRRTMRLADLAPILGLPGCRWINLQYGAVDEEIDRFISETGVRVERLHDATNDFEASAALMTALDLVISVCNTTVHLGGALGRPVWAMAPLASEWRYGMSGSVVAWYPSVDMVRQQRHGDWSSVYAQIAARLGADQQKQA